MLNWLLRWFQRWIGFERVREVRITRSVMEDLAEMARSAHPKEMLAFISATKGVRNGVLVIDEIQLQAYQASVDSASVPLHLLPTFTSIVGTIHSHPSSSTRPSRNDLRLFSQFGLVHGIIGHPYTTRSVRWWSKDGQPVMVTETGR